MRFRFEAAWGFHEGMWRGVFTKEFIGLRKKQGRVRFRFEVAWGFHEGMLGGGVIRGLQPNLDDKHTNKKKKEKRKVESDIQISF